MIALVYTHKWKEGKVSFRNVNIDSHLFYEPRRPRPELQVSLPLNVLRVCVEIGEVSKRLVLCVAF